MDLPFVLCAEYAYGACVMAAGLRTDTCTFLHSADPGVVVHACTYKGSKQEELRVGVGS